MLEVADNVFLVGGTEVNWVVLRDGADLTLIDSGYPGDGPAVEASLREIGSRPEDVRALLLTHAHVDHMGAANHFRERYGDAALHRSDRGAARAARVPRAGRPARCREESVAAGRAALDSADHAGGRGAQGIGAARAAVPVLGRAGCARPSGAGAYARPHVRAHRVHLPHAGVVITGDELITAHAVSRVRPADDRRDVHPSGLRPGAVLAPLAALDADVVLPGHGPVHRGPIAGAVATALDRAT